MGVAWNVVVGVGQDARAAERLEFLQDGRGVADGAEDVDMRPAFPALCTGESAGGAGIVAYGTNVVEWPSPSVLGQIADAVCPRCDGCEVALFSVVEDVAEFGHHAWVEMHLCDGRNDFMTYAL